MSFKSTIVVVEDVLKSRKLYEGVFGLVVDGDFGEYNVGFKGGLALYKKAFFKELSGGLPIGTKSNSFVLYFEYDDIDIYEKRLRDLGLEFVHGAREQPWGQRIFRAYDWDGNMLEVAENMDNVFSRMFKADLGVEEIARITGYPLEDVRKRKREAGA